MPGPVSDSSKGPSNKSPYVPSWCYPNNSPKICPCGHHEGYHNGNGKCLMCNCPGIPDECRTKDKEYDDDFKWFTPSKIQEADE